MIAPLIAIVGRPNVGKSTLYNRLVGGRPALVHNTPGLTRDRRYGDVDYFGHKMRVIDTGGLDPEAAKEVVGAGIHRQAHAAIEEAEAVIFVVDGRAGLMPLDRELADMLRKIDRPLFTADNKVDSPKRDDLAHDFYELGIGELYAISAAHGRGIDELLEAIVDDLEIPRSEFEDDPRKRFRDPDAPLRIALVGKPNAGKSSLLNRLVGSERALVHHAPGTTTDPVDTDIELGGRRYTLVDTAGIRRRARIDAETEKISVSLALSQLERADVAVLVVDAHLGASEQDARIAGAIEQSGRAVVIALNKADLLDGPGAREKAREKTTDELHFLPFAPVHLISAKRGDGVGELMDVVDGCAEQHQRRISTSELNKFFAEVCETHPPPIYKGSAVSIHYLVQGSVRPPTFLLWANRPQSVSVHYRRFVANQLRKRYGFKGTPLRIIVKSKVGKRKKGRKNMRRKMRKR